MSALLNLDQLDDRTEILSLCVLIICPCNVRIMAIGQSLREIACPHCHRPYSERTRKILKECYTRNTEHRG